MKRLIILLLIFFLFINGVISQEIERFTVHNFSTRYKFSDEWTVWSEKDYDVHAIISLTEDGFRIYNKSIDEYAEYVIIGDVEKRVDEDDDIIYSGHVRDEDDEEIFFELLIFTSFEKSDYVQLYFKDEKENLLFNLKRISMDEPLALSINNLYLDSMSIDADYNYDETIATDYNYNDVEIEPDYSSTYDTVPAYAYDSTIDSASYYGENYEWAVDSASLSAEPFDETSFFDKPRVNDYMGETNDPKTKEVIREYEAYIKLFYDVSSNPSAENLKRLVNETKLIQSVTVKKIETLAADDAMLILDYIAWKMEQIEEINKMFNE